LGIEPAERRYKAAAEHRHQSGRPGWDGSAAQIALHLGAARLPQPGVHRHFPLKKKTKAERRFRAVAGSPRSRLGN
jgi:hypothetical protein